MTTVFCCLGLGVPAGVSAWLKLDLTDLRRTICNKDCVTIGVGVSSLVARELVDLGGCSFSCLSVMTAFASFLRSVGNGGGGGTLTSCGGVV